MANLIFKGIQQVFASGFTAENATNGVLYFVRNAETGDAEIYFGKKHYGSLNATQLAGLKASIKQNTDDIAAIDALLGDFSSQMTSNIKTVAQVTKANADAIAELKGDGEGSVTKAIADLKGELAEDDAETLAAINDELDALQVNINNAKNDAITSATAYTATRETEIRKDLTGSIETLNNALDGRIDALEAISGQSHTHENKTVLDGITGDKVAGWDKAKEDIDVFLSGNTVDALDTLKEIQEYISKDGEAADNLVKAIASAQTAADTAQDEVDALELLVGAGFTNEKTVASEIARVEGIADAAQTADEVDTAITTRLADLDFTGSTGGMVVVNLEQNNGKITTFNVNEDGLTNALSALKDGITSYTGTTDTTLTKLRTDVNAVSAATIDNTNAITGEIKARKDAFNTLSGAVDTKVDKTTYETDKASTDSVLAGIRNDLNTITSKAVTSIASAGKTITVVDDKGAVNVEVNTLAHVESGQDGYVIFNKTNDGALYGVMYYGGDDAE